MKTYIGCSVIIYDEKNQVLIAKRSKAKKQFPLLWETIGGSLEIDETPEECIRREVLEEIDCQLYDLELFKVYVLVEEGRYVLIVFTGKVDGNISCNSEIEEVRWIEKAEVECFEFCGNEREKILDYYNK